MASLQCRAPPPPRAVAFNHAQITRSQVDSTTSNGVESAHHRHQVPGFWGIECPILECRLLADTCATDNESTNLCSTAKNWDTKQFLEHFRNIKFIVCFVVIQNAGN